MNISELVKIINDKKDLANKVIDTTHPYKRIQITGQKKRAKEDLEELFMKYRQEIKSRASFMIVTGSQSNKFTEVSCNDFGCLNVDPMAFYNLITEDIDKRLYTNTVMNRNIFDLAMNKFEDIASRLGIIGFPPMYFETKYKKKINNKEDMVNIIAQAFNDKVGSEVIGLFAIDKVSDILVNEGYDQEIVPPIIVNTKNEEMALDFQQNFKTITNKVFLVSAGKVNEDTKNHSFATASNTKKESIEKTLTKVKKNLL